MSVFDTVRMAAIKIQARYRGIFGRRLFKRVKEEMRIKEELMIKEKKENSVENVYVSKKEHRMYRNMLAKKYDNCAVEEQINYFLFSECVLIIQSMYRKYLMRRWFNKYRLYYSKHLKEIIALQANVRKYFACNQSKFQICLQILQSTSALT